VGKAVGKSWSWRPVEVEGDSGKGGGGSGEGGGSHREGIGGGQKGPWKVMEAVG
jgi:hypothetical protein